MLVCDRAKQAWPICSTQLELPAKSPNAREVIHRSFEDPAQSSGSEEEQLKVSDGSETRSENG